MQSLLDVGQCVERRKLPVADFDVTAGAGKLKKILLVAVVKVTETLATSGRRTAGEAIGFEMAAKTKGHGSLKKAAIRFSPFAIREG
jgi:hypothetical protein